MSRRRTQPLEMSLLNVMQKYLSQLEIIWTEIGIPDKQMEARGNTVCSHMENLLKDMVDEELKLQKNFEEKIKRYSQQAASLKKLLCIDDSQESSLEHFALPSNETSSSASSLSHGISGSLLLKEKNARDEVIKLRKIQETRKAKVQLYIECEKKLCLQLDQNPKYTCDVDSYLTESNIASIGSRVAALQENYDKRLLRYETLRFNIMEKLDKYGSPTEAGFMAAIVANAKPMFPLSDEKLQTIETMANNMVFMLRKETASNFANEITKLWQRLEMAKTECDDFEKKYMIINDQISEKAIEALKNELERLKKLEESRLQCQIEEAQQKLAKLKTDNFMESEEDQPICEFKKLQDFLQQLQKNVRVKEACAKDREFVVNKLQTWKAAFDHLLELEERSHDPSRLKNRGGKLLAEERGRKQLQKQMHRMEKNALNAAEQWTAAKGVQFLANDLPLDAYFEIHWKKFIEIRGKLHMQRKLKRKKETEEEMRYGSTNPNKPNRSDPKRLKSDKTMEPKCDASKHLTSWGDVQGVPMKSNLGKFATIPGKKGKMATAAGVSNTTDTMPAKTFIPAMAETRKLRRRSKSESNLAKVGLSIFKRQTVSKKIEGNLNVLPLASGEAAKRYECGEYYSNCAGKDGKEYKEKHDKNILTFLGCVRGQRSAHSSKIDSSHMSLTEVNFSETLQGEPVRDETIFPAADNHREFDALLQERVAKEPNSRSSAYGL
ncbi:protein regulator of cytokinesis 1-like [Clavelina lepadiformis]|uniref:Protein regulator of cytokinesis 1 n=1 Tax=Clavelina lepadiformis TaxID=159417 RepID=A0ABP0H3R1_CLALP